MLTEKELKFLRYLRENSRDSLSSISKKTSIPVSTLFDMLKRLESEVITKHVPLVDFSKLDHGLRVNFALSSRNNQKLKEYLSKHQNVNSLYSLIDNNYSIYAECVFKDMKEMSNFKEQLAPFEIVNIEENFIVEEIKKEGFQP